MTKLWTNSSLSGFMIESVKKKNLWRNFFFPANVEYSAKNLWKMISADETSRSKRYSGCILQIFIRSTFKTWNTM